MSSNALFTSGILTRCSLCDLPVTLPLSHSVCPSLGLWMHSQSLTPWPPPLHSPASTQLTVQLHPASPEEAPHGLHAALRYAVVCKRPICMVKEAYLYGKRGLLTVAYRSNAALRADKTRHENNTSTKSAVLRRTQGCTGEHKSLKFDSVTSSWTPHVSASAVLGAKSGGEAAEEGAADVGAAAQQGGCGGRASVAPGYIRLRLQKCFWREIKVI